MNPITTTAELIRLYKQVRTNSEQICQPLETEDYVVQPVAEVSPPKWHLGHTTWFFETFLLKPYANGYTEYDPQYNYVFNSYYESIGARVIRTDRGNLSRPTVEDVYRYRRHVDTAMLEMLGHSTPAGEITELVILGINHEEQHQELLYTDIKYILGHNPLFPVYKADYPALQSLPVKGPGMIAVKEAVYEVGYKADGFYWDNERGIHKQYLTGFTISSRLVTNGEYQGFIEAGGYHNFRYWHAEGWEWVKQQRLEAPLYWHWINGQWMLYSFRGLEPVRIDEPVCHVSYFEAYAFANWKGMRLPTEFEWEVAAEFFNWGQRWEWTESAYLPYPHFSKAAGALGEYNGKFMVNQQVLRGASEVTPPGHSRNTYRNFFQTNQRWQFTGIRLAK